MSFSMNHLDLDEIVPNSKEVRVKKTVPEYRL